MPRCRPLALLLLALVCTGLTAAPAAAATPPTDRMAVGAVLLPGQGLATANGQVQLAVQPDGDVQLLGQGGDRYFSTGTGGLAGVRLVMQSDGNLVVYDGDGRARWASRTYANPGAHAVLSPDGTLRVIGATGAQLWASPPNSTILPGRTLLPGWSLTAPGGHVWLAMQTDGNLVSYVDGVWNFASRTYGHPGAIAAMQTDGNLVVYDAGRALWASRTYANPGAFTTVQADGFAVVYSAIGTPLWWRDIGAGPGLCAGTQPNPAGTAITRWNPVVLCVLAGLRQSAGNLADVDTLIQQESGGIAGAINKWDRNYLEGHPSEGLIQVIAPTFATYRSTTLPNDLLNPAANLYAGLNYALHTYGSIHNIPGLVSLRNGGPYKGYVVAPG